MKVNVIQFLFFILRLSHTQLHLLQILLGPLNQIPTDMTVVHELGLNILPVSQTASTGKLNIQGLQTDSFSVNSNCVQSSTVGHMLQTNKQKPLDSPDPRHPCNAYYFSLVQSVNTI